MTKRVLKCMCTLNGQDIDDSVKQSLFLFGRSVCITKPDKTERNLIETEMCLQKKCDSMH